MTSQVQARPPLCATCGSALRPEARFCLGCGREAAGVCPSCRSPVRPDDRSCAACSVPLLTKDDAPSLRRAPATASRRARWPVAAAVVAGVLIAVAGAAALRSGGPAPTKPALRASAVSLAEASYPDLGFAVSYPRGWRSARRTIEQGRSAVLFRDPTSGEASAPQRAFDVIAESVPLAQAREGVEGTFRGRFRDYTLIGLFDATVGGRPAFRHEFFASGLRFEQWWVERPDGTFRLTFWQPRTDPHASSELNARIAATFRVV